MFFIIIYLFVKLINVFSALFFVFTFKNNLSVSVPFVVYPEFNVHLLSPITTHTLLDLVIVISYKSYIIKKNYLYDSLYF